MSMNSLFQDTSFWVAMSTVCFFAFLLLKGRKPIEAGLDARSAAIATRIAEADRLKKEAEELLALFKAKNESATQEAAILLTEAKQRADLMCEKAEADLARMLVRIKEGAALRIQQAEATAINTVRAHVVHKTRLLAEQKIAAQPHNFSVHGLAQLKQTL